MSEKKNDIYVFVLTLVVAHSTFISINSAHLVMKYGLELRMGLLAILLLLPYLKIFIKREYLLVNMILMVVFLGILYSSYSYTHSYKGNFFIAAGYALKILCFALYVEFLHHTNNIYKGCKILFGILLFYCMVSDALMFALPKQFGSVGYKQLYLLGDKFHLSYTHMFMVTLYAFLCEIRGQESKKSLYFFYLLSLLIAVYVQCSTAVIGITFIGIAYCIKNKFKKVAGRWYVGLIWIAVCDTILLVNAKILETPVVKFIVKDFLKETIDLTGRSIIYTNVIKVIYTRFWTGVGYENASSVTKEVIRADNLQNGILHTIMTFGMLGLLGLLLFFVVVMVKRKDNGSQAFLLLVYGIILMSAVEITFDMRFYAALLLYLWGRSELHQDIHKEICKQQSLLVSAKGH